ncbi:MAG TPA: ribulose-phosphate 3-epimerase [Syntrophomonadaceae bacterium]|nr:ribulose-phosphate 3-epimerase [Syntrophomonadaceae bacterium]HRX20389.1 ribulose-phosphate 3-epimerase [Syntrophomonadaceae bacterium]
MIIVAPSILSANFTRLGQDIDQVKTAGADWLHIDIMDGHFVPNLTIGPQVVADIRKVTDLFLDVHLMIEKPENFVGAFAEAGADLITVHAEASNHLNRLVNQIKQTGCKAGVSLNPATPAMLLEDIIADVDLILLMTVNPGFGGQSFIPSVLPKIKVVKQMLERQNAAAYLEVDGGINNLNAPEVVRAGANVLVAGSYIFGNPDPTGAVYALKNSI